MQNIIKLKKKIKF
nr:unnamed protein product [Callosobruchus analis]